MRICITQGTDPKIIGFTNALNSIIPNAEIMVWNSNTPIMKMMQELNPNILFFTNTDCTPSHLAYCKAAFPNTKFVLLDKQNDNYDVDLKISLANKSGEKYLDFLGDSVLYANGEFKDKFKSDLCIMSSKNMAENRSLMNWINSISNMFNIKIFGYPAPSAYYLGNVQLHDIRHIIASSKGVIMADPEWYYNSIFNNRIPICFKDESINQKYTFKRKIEWSMVIILEY